MNMPAEPEDDPEYGCEPVLCLGQMPSPLGALMIVTGPAGELYASDYADQSDRLHRLLARRMRRARLQSGPVPPVIIAAVEAYFAGEISGPEAIRVRFNGSPFQNRAWAALRQIRPGQTLSYAAQALRLGAPNAARAVGSANHSNPFNLIIPCHRLIGADGALTGYAGGLERKRWLLDHEARYAAILSPG